MEEGGGLHGAQYCRWRPGGKAPKERGKVERDERRGEEILDVGPARPRGSNRWDSVDGSTPCLVAKETSLEEEDGEEDVDEEEEE